MNRHDVAIRQVTEATVARPSISHFLLATGKIGAQDVSRILHIQNKQGLRFGEAAVKLGLVTEDDIRRALSQQFDYPCLPMGSAAVDRKVIAALMPHDPQVEVLRTLRSQIMLRWRAECKYLVVTAASPGQGTSSIAANLAVVFSQMGTRTLLIDADMRKPSQHELFHLPSYAGLSDILAGHSSAEIIQRMEQIRNLFVLPAGTEPPNPLELLARPTLSALLTDMGCQFDIVIIDTPPSLGCADAQTLCAYAGSALIVARRHHAKIAEIEEVKHQLNIAGAEAVGAVLTDF